MLMNVIVVIKSNFFLEYYWNQRSSLSYSLKYAATFTFLKK